MRCWNWGCHRRIGHLLVIHLFTVVWNMHLDISEKACCFLTAHKELNLAHTSFEQWSAKTSQNTRTRTHTHSHTQPAGSSAFSRQIFKGSTSTLCLLSTRSLAALSSSTRHLKSILNDYVLAFPIFFLPLYLIWPSSSRFIWLGGTEVNHKMPFLFQIYVISNA